MSETKEEQVQNEAGEVRPVNTPRVVVAEDAQVYLLDGGTPDDLRSIEHSDMSAQVIKSHTDQTDPHPQYLMPEELPQTATGWLDAQLDAASPTYRVYKNVKPATPETVLQTTFVGDDQFLFGWIRENAFAEDIDYYQTESKVVIDFLPPTQDTDFYVKIYRKEPNDAETELGTSDTIRINNNDARGLRVFAILISDTSVLAAGDRAVIKLFGSNAGAGGTHTVSLVVEGAGQSRIVTYIPLPAYPAPHAPTHLAGGTDEIVGMAMEQWVADNFSVAGYGGMDLRTPPVAGPDLGAAYVPLTQYDTLSVVAARGCTFDTVTGEFSISIQGVWQLSFVLSFEHNEVNAGRETRLRVSNVTTGSPLGSGIIIPTGRNSPATAFAASILVEVPAAAVGNQLRLELGDGDVYTTVSWNSQVLSLMLASEYRDAV